MSLKRLLRESLASDLTTGWLPPGAPQSEYRPIPAMSASGLKKFRRSPLHYRHEIDHPKPPTPALKLGRATHTAILEPDRYEQLWTVLSQCEGKKADGTRCGYAANLARAGAGYCGRHDPMKGQPERDRVIKLDDHERVMAMREAIMAHPMAAAFIAGHPDFAEIERSGVFEDPQTGAWSKFRPDRILRVGGGYLIDLKTARDASRRVFTRVIADLYILQAAFYLRGIAALGEPLDNFVFVAVESDPPHGVACYEVSQTDLALADEKVTELLNRYKQCVATDNWPGYPEDVQEVFMPPWTFPQENE